MKLLHEHRLIIVKINGLIRARCTALMHTSLQIFNIYGNHIMREALKDWDNDISIGGKTILNLPCADDIGWRRYRGVC